MTTQQNEGTAGFQALLIGIDCYLPNRLPGGGYYPSLRGCVRDIGHVGVLPAGTKLGLTDAQLIRLTATNTGAPKPPRPPGAVADLTRTWWGLRAVNRGPARRPGLRPLLGPRRADPDEVPGPEGGHGLDDRWSRRTSAIRRRLPPRSRVGGDLEADTGPEGLIVTLVLDSCHSGGPPRGINDVGVRGIEETDTTPRPTDSLVAPDQESERVRMLGPRTHPPGPRLGSGWAARAEGLRPVGRLPPERVGLRVCLRWHGADANLTYWLLDALQLFGPGLSYKTLHDRIVAKVHSQFSYSRRCSKAIMTASSSAAIAPGPSMPPACCSTSQAGPRVLLSTGQPQGVRKGAKFIIYPLGTTDFSKAESRLALAEVTDLGATESWSAVKETYRSDAIEQGRRRYLRARPRGFGPEVRLVRQTRDSRPRSTRTRPSPRSSRRWRGAGGSRSLSMRRRPIISWW